MTETVFHLPFLWRDAESPTVGLCPPHGALTLLMALPPVLGHSTASAASGVSPFRKDWRDQ